MQVFQQENKQDGKKQKTLIDEYSEQNDECGKRELEVYCGFVYMQLVEQNTTTKPMEEHVNA